MIENSNNETNFSQKKGLTGTKVSKIGKASVNGSSAKIKFLKTQFSKMIQSRGIVIRDLNISENISSSDLKKEQI